MFCFLLFIALSNAQFLANTKCTSAFCYECEGATCKQCQENFFLEGGNCVYMSEKHCQSVSSIKQQDGTYKDICTKCDSDYQFDFNTLSCVKGEEWCAKIKAYENGTVACIQANPGYALFNNELINCASKNEYCIEFDTSLTYTDKLDICHHCVTCEGLRGVVEGYCEDFEPYLTKNGKCQSGYYQAGSETVNGNDVSVCVEGNVKDCLHYGDKIGKQCTQCINGEWFDGESCKSCRISHCKYCHFRRGDVCIQCEEGYYIGGDGECYELPENCAAALPQGRCVECENGFILNQQTAKCQKCVVANCEECQIEQDGETKTEKCKSCEKGYYLNKEKTQCVKCPSGCSSCTEERCTSCENKDQIPVVGKCVAEIEGCSTYNDDGTCKKCLYELDPKNGKCVENGCIVFDANANKCSRCASGYHFTSDFKCQKCDDLCEPNGRCIYKSDICYGDVDNCLEHNDNKECIVCETGYELDDGFCVPASYYFECVEYLADKESCGLCVEYHRELDKDGKQIEGTQTIVHQYWPDRKGTCGAASSFILMSILLLALIAFF